MTYIELSFVHLINHLLVFQGGEVEKNQQRKKDCIMVFWSNKILNICENIHLLLNKISLTIMFQMHIVLKQKQKKPIQIQNLTL